MKRRLMRTSLIRSERRQSELYYHRIRPNCATLKRASFAAAFGVTDPSWLSAEMRTADGNSYRGYCWSELKGPIAGRLEQRPSLDDRVSLNDQTKDRADLESQVRAGTSMRPSINDVDDVNATESISKQNAHDLMSQDVDEKLLRWQRDCWNAMLQRDCRNANVAKRLQK